jgi:hypothetical protein
MVRKRAGSSQDLDQARVRSCTDYFAILGKTTLAGLSVAILFMSAKLGGRGLLQYHGFGISESYFYAACGTILFATCFGGFLAIYRIPKLIEKLDADALDQIRIHSSIWNFLADFGSPLPVRFQSCLTLGFLIIAWWVCYSAVSVLNPHRWSIGFELMLLGTGILCLSAIGSCESTMRRASSGVNYRRFRLPVIGSATVQDIAVALAGAIGACIALAAQQLI